MNYENVLISTKISGTCMIVQEPNNFDLFCFECFDHVFIYEFLPFTACPIKDNGLYQYWTYYVLIELMKVT